MDKALKTNLVVLCVTLGILFLVLEIPFRLAAHFSEDFLCNTFSDLNDRFLCAMESHLKLSMEKFNQTSGKVDHDICDKWDKDLGWIPRENCRTTLYTTNSLGFRGVREYPPLKTKPRIIVLGDSFTWGENNADNETYPFYLEQLFGGEVEVINMGVHGYGPDQFYLYYLREGHKLNPDIVIFGLFLPDIHRTAFHTREFFKPRFLIVNDTLALDPQSSIPSFEEALKRSSEIKHKPRLYMFSYFHGFFTKLVRLLHHYKDDTEITLKVIETLNSQLQKESISLIVLFIPEQEMVEGGNKDYYDTIPVLEEELKKRNISYVNFQPIFQKESHQRGRTLYRGHMTQEGNKLIAETLHGFSLLYNLTQQKYINKTTGNGKK
jgi:hypothetical protein